MGNTSGNQETLIGQVLVNEQDGNASFTYEGIDKIRLNLIVQDKLGRSMYNKSFELEGGPVELSFKTDSLSSGTYHAWIYIGDEVQIRTFGIKKTEEKGLISKFLSIFK